MIALTIVQITTGRVTRLPLHPGITTGKVEVEAGAASTEGKRKSVVVARGVVVGGKIDVGVGGVGSITRAHRHHHRHTVARVMIPLLLQRKKDQDQGMVDRSAK